MDVFYANARVKEFRRWWAPEKSLLRRMERLFFEAGLDDLVARGARVGIKLHMGEPGNVHHIRPIYASTLVKVVKELGGAPAIVETCGLGTSRGRTSAEKHLDAARRNGFAEETLGAQIAMMDGEKGLDCSYVDGVAIAKGLLELDSLIVLSHATGHLETGFAGAIKNLALGCVAKPGKYRVHHTGKPWIESGRCDSCEECVAACTVGAIKLDPPRIGEECIECGDCLDACERGAIKAKVNDASVIARRVAENAASVAKAAKGRIGYMNMLMDILPHCDCHPHSDIPIVPDLGVLASKDPVAIDHASIELINSSPGIAGSEAEHAGALGRSSDKFLLINPSADWRRQIRAAEESGIGNRIYSLKELT